MTWFKMTKNYGKSITILQQIMQMVCSHSTWNIVARIEAQFISTVFINTKVKIYFFFIEINAKVFETSSKTGHNVGMYL